MFGYESEPSSVDSVCVTTTTKAFQKYLNQEILFFIDDLGTILLGFTYQFQTGPYQLMFRIIRPLLSLYCYTEYYSIKKMKKIL